MLRLTKSLLPILIALLYAGTATAYVISAVETSTGPYGPSDTLVVDVWLDTEGESFYGFILYVDHDLALLSPNVGESVMYQIPGAVPAYSYFYLSEDEDWWYATQSNIVTPIPPVNMPILTLVYHVIDVPNSTWIEPNFDGLYAVFVDGNVQDVTGEVLLYALHVPEPTTTMLMGLGLFGILYASRRR